MLGYVVAEGRGVADALLAGVAAELGGLGWPLAGALQINQDRGPDRRCDMDLQILSGHQIIRISQDLGALAQGCRLDPGALERAVGLVEAALAQRPRLLIINKFGKQEADGRGFRPLIGRALAEGIPVLTSVNPDGLARFEDFAGGLGQPLSAEKEAVLNWCRSAAR